MASGAARVQARAGAQCCEQEGQCVAVKDREAAGEHQLLRDHIVARTCRLADAMLSVSSRQIKALWKVSNTDLRLLSTLESGEPLTVAEVSRRALVDQAWVSRSLRALAGRKLVQRQKDPRDSRATLVSLTRRGREILEESRPYAQWSEQMLLKGLDEGMLKALLDQLEANTHEMLEALEQFRASGGKPALLSRAARRKPD
jgi:DNA-binding MarR family transcriptional regulator